MVKFILLLFYLVFIIKYLNKKIKMLIMNYLIINMFFMLLINYKMMNLYFNKIYLCFMYDMISYSLIILVFWIMFLSMFINMNFIMMKFNTNFILLILFLILFMVLYFMSMNLIFFYIFFESSLIPMFMLIMGWGMQIDRIQASMFMLLYTIFSSLPMLLLFIYIYLFNKTIDLNCLYFDYNKFIIKFYIYMFLISGFLIKMPMYFVHLWLPKAHVEAPISGSMILAGVMLKLGSYGIYRLIMIFPKLFINYNMIMINIMLLGGVYSSIICLNLNDYKIIVAYSSVVHMSTVMSSLMSLNNWGFMGAYFMMIAHGLCSSGLFILVNLNYECLGSRLIMINKGLLNLIPSLSLWWFLFCISNMSAPISLNLIGEIMMINSLILFFKKFIFYLFMLIFFSSCYNMFMFSFSQHGVYNFNMKSFKSIELSKYLILIFHWFPLNFIFLNLNLIY
uniref:NADH-ubiquinone oxidoreductase chain 4 n=1 Tax=Proterops sp. QL-2014 TaxID=1491724 RepID=A0A0U1WEJ5_9HYME|nr:NADH dehydrogenase subunit 4 [Proterops sp. QL-2014]